MPESNPIYENMKHLILPFVLVTFSLGCSRGIPDSIEQPILTAETLAFFKVGFNELDSKALVSKGAGSFSSGDSKAARDTSYFVDLNCAPQDASALVEAFHAHLLDALEVAGATVVKDEVLEGDKLAGPLEIMDGRSVEGGVSINKNWHSVFSIAYSKSKVVGGISVGYKITESGQNILQLSQVENQ